MHSAEKKWKKKKRVERSKKKKLQAQTKIIKIKAKNKHNKILNSNNCEEKKSCVEWGVENCPRYYSFSPLVCLLSTQKKKASDDSTLLFFLCRKSLNNFFPFIGRGKKEEQKWKVFRVEKFLLTSSVIFHVEKETTKKKSYFSFVIKYFSVNNFFN